MSNRDSAFQSDVAAPEHKCQGRVISKLSGFQSPQLIISYRSKKLPFIPAVRKTNISLEIVIQRMSLFPGFIAPDYPRHICFETDLDKERNNDISRKLCL